MKTLKKILIPILLVLIISCQQKTLQLEITSNHEGALVYFNEDSIGSTPITVNTYPGIIKVFVKKEGYENFVYSDTLNNDTIVKIHAQLLTKEEIVRIEEQKHREEQIRKQKEAEKQSFIINKSGLFTDYRDMHKYKWIKIGKQIWMAENLAYKIESESGKYWAYDNKSSNVKAYGYLYDWKSAKEVCPEGWHLPTEQEWQEFVTYLGGDRIASEKMREQGFKHWIDGYYYRPIATNASDFTARPGGQRNDKGKFITIGTYALWWSSTQKDDFNALYYWLGYMGDYLNKDIQKKNFGLSVRCVKD